MTGEPWVVPVADVCDPIPCARTELVAESVTTGGLVRRTITTFDRIDVDAVHAGPRRDATTGFRFCRCSMAESDTEDSRQACATPGATRYDGGCTLAAPSLYDAVRESTPWRFATMTDSATDPERPALPLGAEVQISYSAAPDSEFIRDWHGRLRLHQDDIPRWRLARLSPADGPEVIPSGALSGVFWTHTSGYVGSGAFDPETRRLANHYWSGPFSPAVESAAALRRLVEPIAPIIRGWDWFGRRGFLVRDARVAGGIGTLLASAVTRPVDSHEAHQFAYFSSPGRWVPAAESIAELRGTVVRYLSVSPAGIGTTIGEVNGAFVDLSNPNCPPGQCPPPGGSQFAAIASAAVAFDTSSGVSILSATQEMLWVLRDATSSGDASLVAYDLRSGIWSERQLPVVGDILAATYSASDGALWVLDQIRVGPRRFARLLAILPDTGYVTESARWPRLTRHDRFELAATSGRGLYLAAGFGGAHVIALIDMSSHDARLRGVRLAAGNLPANTTVLRADDRGVSVLSESGRDYTLSDYSEGSFTSGWMGSCL